SSPSSSSYSPVQQILAFYTAQLLCRLLTYSLSNEADNHNFDRWIWLPRWTVEVKGRGGVARRRKERRGLGLRAPLEVDGMPWIPRDHFDWQRGHLSVEVLIDLYMPRSPLQ